MPLVTIPYILSSGDVLDTTNFNKNVFDGTSGNGIMSTPNGGLEYDPTGTTKNLHNDFVLYPEHVQPYAGIMGGMDTNIKPVDVSSDVFSDSTTASYLRVPGPSTRIDIERDADAVLLFLSYYVHFFIPTRDGGIGGISSPDVIVRPVYNGTAVTNLSRILPPTVPFDTSDTRVDELSVESRASRYYNMPYLATDVSAGPSEFALQIYIERTNLSASIIRQFGLGTGVNKGKLVTYAVTAGVRITFGCRCAGHLIL